MKRSLSRAGIRGPLLAAAAMAALAAGCTTTTYVPQPITGVDIPIKDTTPKPRAPEITKEAPPASGPARELHVPKAAWAELPSGLKFAAVESHALPIVQLRVVVLGGRSADGDKPGLTALTSELLEAGGAGSMSSRDLVTRIESLGGHLSITTGFDRTTLGLAVTKDHLAEALDLLGTIVREPRLDQAEFEKLKKRKIDRAADLARTNGKWAASMVLWRDLFAMPAEHHPYASFDATPADLAKLTANDCRALHRRLFVPKNTFVVVAGDTTAAEVAALAAKSFGAYRGGDAPVFSFTDPMPPEALKITLVDRPKSAQSDVFVGLLGPDRTDKSWAAFAAGNQVLGGGVASRLFLDVRETQSLAYETRSSIAEVAHGPALLVAYAGTQTPKTGLALKALLDNLGRLGSAAPSDTEMETATRYLADVFAVKLETIGAVADEVAELRTLGLPDDYDEGFRKELRDLTPALVGHVAGEHVRTGHEIVVVAGDAAVVGPMLSHFGEVKVLDPTKSFERVRTIAMDAGAAIEGP
jgi:zinc protease